MGTALADLLEQVLKEAPSSGARTAVNNGFDRPAAGGLAGTDWGTATDDDGGGFGFGDIFDVAKKVVPKGLDWLDTPRAAVASTVKETVDFGQGEGFDLGDWWNQSADNYGFGDLIEEETDIQNQWVKRGLGLVGDVALDPLTYFGGASAVTRLGRTGLAGRAFEKGLPDLGQRILQKGLSTADASDLAKLSNTAGELKKGVFFGVGKHQKRVSKTGSGQRGFDAVASQVRKYGTKSRLNGVFGGANNAAKQKMLFGTPQQASNTFLTVRNAGLANNAAKVFGAQFDAEALPVMKALVQADPEVRKLVPHALNGDPAAIAQLAVDAPNLFEPLEAFVHGMPDRANQFLTKANNLDTKAEVFAFREDWHGLTTNDEIFDFAFDSSGKKLGPAGFELKAKLVPGERFNHVLLTEVTPGNSIPAQVRRIIEDHEKLFGEGSFKQLYSDDIVTSLQARFRSYTNAVRNRDLEIKLDRAGVSYVIPGSVDDYRLPKTLEEATSTAFGRRLLEQGRVRQLEDQIRAESGGELDQLVRGLFDPEGVAADAVADAASRRLRASEFKLDRLRRRQFELDQGKLSSDEFRELARLQDQIDAELEVSARALADGGAATVGGGLSVEDALVRRDELLAQAELDGSVLPEVQRLGRLAEVGRSARETGSLINPESPGGVWYHGTKTGLDVGAGRTSGVQGVGSSFDSRLGIHLAPRKAISDEYVADGGRVLELKVSASNPMIFDGRWSKLNETIEAWARSQGFLKNPENLFSDDGIPLVGLNEVYGIGNMDEAADAYRVHLQSQGYDSVMYNHRNELGEFSQVVIPLDASQISAAGDETLAPDWFREVDDHIKQIRGVQQESAAAIDIEIQKLTHDINAHRIDPDNLASVDADNVRITELGVKSKRERMLRDVATEAIADRNSLAEAGASEAAGYAGVAAKLAADVERKLADGSLVLPTADQTVAQLKRRDIQDTLDVLMKDGFRNLSNTSIAPAEVAETIEAATRLLGDPEGLVKYVDQANRIFKTYATLTPGFHARNFLGGTFNNMLAGVSIRAHREFLPMHRTYARQIGKGVTPDQALAQATRNVDATQAKAFRDVVESGQVASAGRTVDTDANFDELDTLFKRAKASPTVQTAKAVSNKVSLTKLGYRAGNRTEDTLRGVMAYDSFLKGSSHAEAIERVAKYHFDYSDLSDFEYNKARRVIPFYTWSRKNLPLQIESMLTNPKAYTRIMHLKRNIELGVEEEETVPGYVQESLHIRTPWKTGVLKNVPGVGGLVGDADDRIYIMPDLPFRELTRAVDPGEIFGSTTPYLKTPLERKFGKKSFNNIPFRLNPQRVPETWEKFGLAQAMGAAGVAEQIDGNWYATDKNIYTVEQLWSPLARTRRLLPSDDDAAFKDRQLTTMVNFLFGAGAFTNTERAINNELYSRELKERERRNYQDGLDDIRNGK